MALAALAVWGVTAVVGDARLGFDVALGTLGPLVGAGVTWLWIERAHAKDPAKLTSPMVAAFGFHAVFLGLYLAAVLGWTSVRSIPFVLCFTGSFVLFHAMEAFFLHRLLRQSGASGS